MTTSERELAARPGIPLWVSGLIPLIALGLMLAVFAVGNPLAMFRAELPPIENLSFERISVTPAGFEAHLVNGGPDPVTIAQVMVDDAFWQFEVQPSVTLPRLGRAVLKVAYPWVQAEPNVLRIVTSTGVTFDGQVALATAAPRPSLAQFGAYGLLGIYVGIIPVALGLMWYPVMRRMGRKWLGGVLALTLGLLVFLLIDTLLEAFEVAGKLPGAFQGIPLVLFAALLTWLALLAIGASRRKGTGSQPAARRAFYLSALIAFSIGLHNLGEGLAIGAAFALGEAALGSFLVIGFTLHNITEGVGIAAPLVSGKRTDDAAASAAGAVATPAGPSFLTFLGLALVAGSPAIFGAWIGGFAFSPLLASIFLGMGVGAIWQVLVEVTGLLKGYADRAGESLYSWVNVGGFVAGLAIMYFTALLVK
jgi:zinc transporter, ZIP family